MAILALDLGTTTGYALHTGISMDSGSVCFNNANRVEGGGMRYLRFRRWLTDKKQCGVTEVYFEEVRNHKGVHAAHVYGGFLSQLMVWCEQNDIAYSSVPVGNIKKFATGKGNSNKEAMIQAAKNLGFDVVDDNEADAIHLLRYVMDKVDTGVEVLA